VADCVDWFYQIHFRIQISQRRQFACQQYNFVNLQFRRSVLLSIQQARTSQLAIQFNPISIHSIQQISQRQKFSNSSNQSPEKFAFNNSANQSIQIGA